MGKYFKQFDKKIFCYNETEIKFFLDEKEYIAHGEYSFFSGLRIFDNDLVKKSLNY